MESLNVDYDRATIPAVYDLGRDHGPEVLNLWISVIEAHVDGATIGTILDLGCGTGRLSEGMAIRCSARVVGIDPSEKMLNQARRKPAFTTNAAPQKRFRSWTEPST
jgi:2-polyprenyl-3-methyl-5-hydroxy-6-metoxy-1,4-benzoquinol methylase